MAVDTKFTATITAGAPGGWIDPTGPGILPNVVHPGEPQAVAEITAAVFSVLWVFEAKLASGGAFTAFNSLFDSLSTTGGFELAKTSFSGDFWHTAAAAAPAPIPLPAAFPLFGTGLGILGFLGWRRRRKAAVAV